MTRAAPLVLSFVLGVLMALAAVIAERPVTHYAMSSQPMEPPMSRQSGIAQ